MQATSTTSQKASGSQNAEATHEDAGYIDATAEAIEKFQVETGKHLDTEIENGDTVLNYGYEFLVTEVDGGTTLTAHGQRVWYFTGICTDSPRNNSIRHTCYNGGRYSWRKGENLTKGGN